MLQFGDLYERLTADQFQGLVSAIVTRENPRTQCMPLTGRDGGRDVIAQEIEQHKMRDAIVFQVKTKAVSPLGTPTADEIYSWVTKNIRGELPKLVKLKQRGLREYKFVTNIPATGDLDVGLRDRVQDYLNETLPVPALVWWREDIDTRLRAYPEIAASHGLLVGAEALSSLCVDLKNSENSQEFSYMKKEKFDSAMKSVLAFCSQQFKDEDKMRFRQVDLDRVRVHDLFIDVPASLVSSDRQASIPRQQRIAFREALIARGSRQISETVDESIEWSPSAHGQYLFGEIEESIGLADVLLLSKSSSLGKVIVEGAPGQGKSTASQYVCQVHRMRLLKKSLELDAIDETHRFSQVRIPIRIELRRYAKWLSEQGENESGLITYIGVLLQKASSLDISVVEVSKLLCGAPSLLMLDGLDEVPDLKIREQVLKSIDQLSENLDVWEADSRIVVTTRPSTLMRESILEQDGFVRISLSDLPSRLIKQYSEKWLQARALDDEEAQEFRAVLTAALASPHVADLARNPMQLAILLHLVHVKGWSMPDRRTALYHEYLDTFLTRESEKNIAVRQNRGLLLELHGYIAWILHTDAEGDGTSLSAAGDIDRDALIRLVEDYLRKEERDTSLAAVVFSGVQRFFVLVERDEGRFEFEVQPLREFFAARYLYSSGASGPSSMSLKGSRPDILDALLGSPYWTNVTRFYCGYYQKGELPGLARQLEDLVSTSNIRDTVYSYSIIERLMRDYTLSDSQRDTNHLMRVLMRNPGLRLISQNPAGRGRVSPAVPFDNESGRAVLVESVRSKLLEDQPPEILRELCSVAVVNDDGRVDWWASIYEDRFSKNLTDTRARSKWIVLGKLLGAIESLELDRAVKIFRKGSGLKDSDWFSIVESGRMDIACYNKYNLERTLLVLADGPSISLHQLRSSSPLSMLSFRISNYRWSSLGRSEYDAEIRIGLDDDDSDEVDYPSRKLSGRPGRIQSIEMKMTASSYSPLANSADSHRSRWIELLKNAYEIFGGRWVVWRMSFFAACYTAFDGNVVEANPVISEVHLMSTKSDDIDYWRRVITDSELNTAAQVSRRLAVTVALLIWTKAHVIRDVLPEMGRWWSKIDEMHLADMRTLLIDLTAQNGLIDMGLVVEGIPIEEVPTSLALLLAIRMKSPERRKLTTRLRKSESQSDSPFVQGDLANACIIEFFRSPTDGLLREIAKYFLNATPVYPALLTLDGPRGFTAGGVKRVSLNQISEVIHNPGKYPWILVDRMNSLHMDIYSKESNTMREKSIEGSWFERS